MPVSFHIVIVVIIIIITITHQLAALKIIEWSLISDIYSLALSRPLTRVIYYERLYSRRPSLFRCCWLKTQSVNSINLPLECRRYPQDCLLGLADCWSDFSCNLVFFLLQFLFVTFLFSFAQLTRLAGYQWRCMGHMSVTFFRTFDGL